MDIGDANLFYEEIGCGEPVLFLHSGYSRGILAFSGQIQPFYAEGYRGIYPDFRGHGRTVSDSLYWDSDLLAQDMLRFMVGLGLEQVHLVGYSTGGGVAYYLAARHPERIKTIITIGNGGSINDEGAEDYLPEALIRDGQWDFIEKNKQLHKDAHRGNWQEYCRMEVEDWKHHPKLSEEEWRRITMPMLLIAGDNDHYASRESLEAICSRCPQAQIYIAEGCGHGAHMPAQDAQGINRIMLDFLKQNKGK